MTARRRLTSAFGLAAFLAIVTGVGALLVSLPACTPACGPDNPCPVGELCIDLVCRPESLSGH